MPMTILMPIFRSARVSGCRMNLPFGQVRLDVACALSDADYPLRIHLTIGADLINGVTSFLTKRE